MRASTESKTRYSRLDVRLLPKTKRTSWRGMMESVQEGLGSGKSPRFLSTKVGVDNAACAMQGKEYADVSFHSNFATINFVNIIILMRILNFLLIIFTCMYFILNALTRLWHNSHCNRFYLVQFWEKFIWVGNFIKYKYCNNNNEQQLAIYILWTCVVF